MKLSNMSRLLLLLLLLPFLGQTQALQSPADFHYHPFGEAFTPHHALVDYVQHVAANSPHAVIQEYGRTNEERPLLALTISSPANLERLEEIRKSHLQGLGLETGRPTIKDEIAIIWLSYGVHGNEAAASESAMLTLHQLADPTNERTREWLENTVVILDPCLNPDGFDRYISWYKTTRHKQPNMHLDDREHQEPWPKGRHNHYYFDLNRDWVWQTQVETKQRLALYQQWMPHVHVDVHEMGVESPYFFAPAAEPMHDYITDWQKDFQAISGKNHSKYFDQQGWLYYTKQVFDLFYPSYGDTYPTFNGSVGMTYEQGGSHRAGRAVIRRSGDTLTLMQRIEAHKTTCLSTVEAAAANADRLILEMKSYFEQNRMNPPGKYRSYIIKRSASAEGRIDQLLQLFDAHQIEYSNCTGSGSASGFDFQTGETGVFKYDQQDILIPVKQSKGTLVQVLMEPQSNLEDSLTYDITAWSLPYAYHLQAYALTEALRKADGYAMPTVSSPSAAQAQYAYAIPWNAGKTIRMVGDLLEQGAILRYAEKAFKMGGRSFEPGTILILRAENKALVQQLPAMLGNLSKQHQVSIYGFDTGMAQDGPDLGSGDMRLLRKPKVMLWSSDEVSSQAVGQFWHLFDEEWEYPLTIGTGNSIRDLDLESYTHLILPEGRYPSASPLKDWVQEGGTILAIGSALRAFDNDQSFGIAQTEAKASSSTPSAVSDYTNQERDRMTRRLAGAVIEIELDGSHPLAFGLGDRYFSLKNRSTSYEPLKEGWNIGLADRPRAGFVGSNIRSGLKGKLNIGLQPMQRGKVIYMVDNPLYRSFWVAGKQLVANAIFFN